MNYTAYILLLVAFLIAVALLRLRKRVVVYPWESGLLYRGGAFKRVLPDGRHRYFDLRGDAVLARVPTTDQQARFGALDVISADQFAFRLHVALTYRFPDPQAAYEAQIVVDYGTPPTLNDVLAAAALRVVGAKPLDAVLSAPPAIADDIAQALAGAVPHVEIVSVLLVKLDLPPETRRMLTEAERARREGLAALERARAEQASLRALANAARLVKDNPELAQLRLLRTIEDAKGPTTIVLGDPRTAAVS